jgi:hypothetical protein
MKHAKLLLVFLPALFTTSCDDAPLDEARLAAAEANVDRAAGSCTPEACGEYIPANTCQCDDACVFYGDCCDDVDAVCNAQPPVDACEDNDDCPEFCGWNADGLRECKPWAQAGESCEGFVLPEFRAQCAPGLECEFSEPTFDVPGTCVAPVDECEDNDDCPEFCGWNADGLRECKPWAQVGESCEGFVLPEFRAQCAPGLECEFSEPTFDVPGTCVEPDASAFCGGIAGIQCPAGQHCELDGDFPDAGGSCQPGSAVGGACGGIAGFVCIEGLECFIESTLPDADGVCVEVVDANSCEGHCGGQADAGCYCDDACAFWGDCCDDKVAVCG